MKQHGCNAETIEAILETVLDDQKRGKQIPRSRPRPKRPPFVGVTLTRFKLRSQWLIPGLFTPAIANPFQIPAAENPLRP